MIWSALGAIVILAAVIAVCAGVIFIGLALLAGANMPTGPDGETHGILVIGIIAVAVGILVIIGMATMTPAAAHDAPKGWSYPFACCSGVDCREVNGPGAPIRITEQSGGYVVSSTGEFVPQSDARIRVSPDGEYHWCSVDGRDDTRTICLFVPPPSY